MLMQLPQIYLLFKIILKYLLRALVVLRQNYLYPVVRPQQNAVLDQNRRLPQLVSP